MEEESGNFSDAFCIAEKSTALHDSPSKSPKCIKKSGVGFGLRHKHFIDFWKNRKSLSSVINWLEVHPENFVSLGSGFEALQELSEGYNLSYHGVGLSLGTKWDEESGKHLNRLKVLIDKLPCNSFSEHISWSRHESRHTHDLLPILYDNESMGVIVDNIKRVQDHLGMQIAVENPSIYTQLNHKYSETDFIAEILEKAGCELLLDINNIEVCSFNLGFEMKEYIDKIDFSKIREIHIAGHTEQEVQGNVIKVDTHSRVASKKVMEHLKRVISDFRFKGFVMYEWDEEMPEFKDFMKEVGALADIYSEFGANNKNCESESAELSA